MSTYDVIETGRGLIKMWTRGVPVEDGAKTQLKNIADLPFIHSHVAAMPDVHFGRGATVGSVIATRGAIIPAAVGVDIGCGMMATQTTLTADQLPDSLATLRSVIEKAVPHGNGRGGNWGQYPRPRRQPFSEKADWRNRLRICAPNIRAWKKPKLCHSSARSAAVTTSSKSVWMKQTACG